MGCGRCLLALQALMDGSQLMYISDPVLFFAAAAAAYVLAALCHIPQPAAGSLLLLLLPLLNP